MELSVLLLLVLLTGLLLLLARGNPKAHGRLPPGPSPLQFFGNLLQTDKRDLSKLFLRVRCKWKGSEGGSLSPYLVITHQEAFQAQVWDVQRLGRKKHGAEARCMVDRLSEASCSVESSWHCPCSGQVGVMRSLGMSQGYRISHQQSNTFSSVNKREQRLAHVNTRTM